jgi:hypothetical protein
LPALRALIAALLALPAGSLAASELDDATTMFRAVYAAECETVYVPFRTAAPTPPDVYELRYRSTSADDGVAPRSLRLYRFPCTRGAYNNSHVFLAADDIEGLRPLQFAEPTYIIIYEGDDPTSPDAKVRQIQVTGIATVPRLDNAKVDPVSGTISATSYWRSAGDAFASGEWRLIDGAFVLARFDIDASFDGAANPSRVINYMGTAAAIR